MTFPNPIHPNQKCIKFPFTDSEKLTSRSWFLFMQDTFLHFWWHYHCLCTVSNPMSTSPNGRIFLFYGWERTNFTCWNISRLLMTMKYGYTLARESAAGAFLLSDCCMSTQVPPSPSVPSLSVTLSSYWCSCHPTLKNGHLNPHLMYSMTPLRSTALTFTFLPLSTAVSCMFYLISHGKQIICSQRIHTEKKKGLNINLLLLLLYCS